MTSFTRGRAAEARAAAFLAASGYTILAQNWQTRWCEIDIVAKDAKTVYFVEVKYRSSNAWGDGAEYITKKKLQQMRFAAESWVHEERWNGGYELLVASVDDHQISLIFDPMV